MIAMGIDLAAFEKNQTGIATVDENLNCVSFTVFSDNEIIMVAKLIMPDVILIDAPLSIPRGRSSIDDKGGPHFRKCDLQLRQLGIRFFPITLGPMRDLTKRGIKIKDALSRLGFSVFESYPGGVQDLLGMHRNKELGMLLNDLKLVLGLKGCFPESPHEADAATIAYLGIEYLKGRAVGLGDKDEGLLFLPATEQVISVKRSS